MKNFCRMIVLLMIMLIAFMQAVVAENEALPDLIFNGNIQSPVTIHADSISFSYLSPFDELRTESMNRLMRHFSFDITSDGDKRNDCFVYIDEEPLYSEIEMEKDQSVLSFYSLAPESVFARKKKESQDDFLSFLDNRFFILNRLLDDLYPLFEKIPLKFPDKAKTEKVSLNYTGYGKGVKKMIFSFSAEEVENEFPSCLLELTDSKYIAELLNSMIFNGPQKIILIYDSEDHLLRINYDGKAGFTEDDIRKLSIVCRSVRNNDNKKDKLTIKAPAVKGYNRNNIIYERTIDLSESIQKSMCFDYQLDNRLGTNRSKIHFYSDLSLKGTEFNGNMTYEQSGTNGDHKTVIKPEMNVNDKGEYFGTLEIIRKTGKIVLLGMKASVLVSAGNFIQYPEMALSSVIDAESESGIDALSDVQDEIAGILINRITSLPKEDIDFIYHGISDSDWNLLFDSIM